MINLKAAAQSVRAKDKERGRKKNRWSAFTILWFETQDWIFLFPVPHRVKRQRLLPGVCLGSWIVVFTWGQNCFEKTLVVVWFRSLVVKARGMFYDDGCRADAKKKRCVSLEAGCGPHMQSGCHASHHSDTPLTRTDHKTPGVDGSLLHADWSERYRLLQRSYRVT